MLEPAQFSNPEVHRVYWIASKTPTTLNKLHCWCGCENRGVHRSSLAHLEDTLATRCAVCRGTAEIAYQMVQKGVTERASPGRR